MLAALLARDGLEALLGAGADIALRTWIDRRSRRSAHVSCASSGGRMSMSLATLGDSLRLRRRAGNSQSRLSRPSSFWSLHLGRGGRPLTVYDAPPADGNAEDDDETPAEPYDEGARTNGVRVWYSSFSSIDWLHDAVSACLLHLAVLTPPTD